MSESNMTALPDTERHWLIATLPEPLRPYALLARFDRPIGWWLLFWPCVWGVALAGEATARWDLLLWFLLGAIATRGAGCVYNDIVDRDLDRKVERTRSRPLASGRVGLKGAWIWLFLLALIGLVVLLQLRTEAQIVALASIVLVAAYPFMKRITWWPQAWLGLVFSWGAPVGWVAVTGDWQAPAMLWLYAGSVFWVIGYDTIYALQDIEDDALAGVKSSARRLGGVARGGVGLFYVLALACWAMALWTIRPESLGLAALLPMALHLLWQIATLRTESGEDALAKFRSNRDAGLLLALGLFVVGATA
ncbi:MAG: 4-hydroxybenzoate octaprenyltransferase [Sphingomonadaceae bacterium]|nr:4-hydroxybenzoate octaprenyltransferase [Sphingomonadaceae bacterium]